MELLKCNKCEYRFAMSVFVFLIAFALGYGVRETISCRHRKKCRQCDRQDANRVDPIELEVLGSNEGIRVDASQPPKAVISGPESFELKHCGYTIHRARLGGSARLGTRGCLTRKNVATSSVLSLSMITAKQMSHKMMRYRYRTDTLTRMIELPWRPRLAPDMVTENESSPLKSRGAL